MKLNKQQINALASKFYNELITEYNRVNEIFKKEQLKKFKPDYEKGVKLLKDNPFLNSININVSNYAIQLSRKTSFENYINNYSFRTYLIKGIERDIPTKRDIENDIILATIDSTSVDEIMKILKQKYK